MIFEFLSRYTDTGKLTIEDQAEQRVLWDMCGLTDARFTSAQQP